MAITFPFSTYWGYISESTAQEASERQRNRAETVAGMIRTLAESNFTGGWDEHELTIYRNGEEGRLLEFYLGAYVTAVSEIRVNGEVLDDSKYSFHKMSQVVYRLDGEEFPEYDPDLAYIPEKTECNIEIDVTAGWAEDADMDADVNWRTTRWVVITAEQTINRLSAQNDDPLARKPVGLDQIARYFDSVGRRLP